MGVVLLAKRHLHADASMVPLSHITRQFCGHEAARSKNVSSICIIVLIRFCWKWNTENIESIEDYYSLTLLLTRSGDIMHLVMSVFGRFA